MKFRPWWFRGVIEGGRSIAARTAREPLTLEAMRAKLAERSSIARAGDVEVWIKTEGLPDPSCGALFLKTEGETRALIFPRKRYAEFVRALEALVRGRA